VLPVIALALLVGLGFSAAPASAQYCNYYAGVCSYPGLYQSSSPYSYYYGNSSYYNNNNLYSKVRKATEH
jgi:hypothetical protein